MQIKNWISIIKILRAPSYVANKTSRGEIRFNLIKILKYYAILNILYKNNKLHKSILDKMYIKINCK